MKDKSQAIALRCLRICTAVATVVMIAILIWQCIDIYWIGNRPENVLGPGVYQEQVYRRDDVANRLSGLLIPFVTYVMLLLLTAVAHIAWGKEAARSGMTPENRLRLMKKRIADLPAEAAKEESFRQKAWTVAGILMGICAVPCVVYLAQRSHFTDKDPVAPIDAMLLHVVPWVVAAFAVAVIAYILCGKSAEREIAALKGVKMSSTVTKEEKTSRTNIIRAVLYTAAVLFILLGVMNGGAWDVLVKAIKICTECIGLG